MNRQYDLVNGEKVNRKIEWTDYTWNPLVGCLHDCEWAMPSGERAVCYAKKIVEGRWLKARYPGGFEASYYHPERLVEPKKLKTPAKIFPDSVSDLFGNWVQKQHLVQVLDVMRATPQHIYQALTKNTVAYRNVDALPPNLWAGISSPPDHFMGNDLNEKQKERYLHTALKTLALTAERGYVTWMSFEPLSLDWAHIVAQYPGALKWAVIGAASNGSKLYPPREHDVHELVCTLLGQGVKIFYKGNMRSLPYALEHWYEEFPLVEAVTA